MEKLKYGIIGTNGIALEKHLPFYAAMKDDVELVAACDNNAARLQGVADQYGIPLRFSDWRDLLATPGIDFVSVCLPNFLHAPVTIEALRAGKHVHCEKPMATNAPEARAMLDESRKCGKKLMIGLNNRFTPWSRYVKNQIDDGTLGDIYFAKCSWVRRNGLPPGGDSWFVQKAKSGGGALIDLGVHYIDLMMHFMGFPAVRSVMARTYNLLATGPDAGLFAQKQTGSYGNLFDVEDLAAGFIETASGSSISFEVNWASHTEVEKRSYELYGTKGGARFIQVPGRNPELTLFTLAGGRHVDIHPVLPVAYLDEMECLEFISCIRDNRDPAIAPPEEAVEMMVIMDAIYRSAAEGRQIIL